MFLSGGEGNDFLLGDKDTNILFGGQGADTFAIAKAGNTITDFEPGVDTIQLPDNIGFADLTLEEVAGGTGVVISFANSGITTVAGISLDALSPANFQSDCEQTRRSFS